MNGRQQMESSLPRSVIEVVHESFREEPGLGLQPLQLFPTEVIPAAWVAAAGDMVDSILDPSFLKAFRKLLLLSIHTSMFWRMTRWSALSFLDFVPHCQLEVEGMV